MPMDKICWNDAERGKPLSLMRIGVFSMTPIAKISRSRSTVASTSVRPVTSTTLSLKTANRPQKCELMILRSFAFLSVILPLALPSRVSSSFSLSLLPFYACCPEDAGEKTCPPRARPSTVDPTLILPILRIAAKISWESAEICLLVSWNLENQLKSEKSAEI